MQFCMQLTSFKIVYIFCISIFLFTFLFSLHICIHIFFVESNKT